MSSRLQPKSVLSSRKSANVTSSSVSKFPSAHPAFADGADMVLYAIEGDPEFHPAL